LHTSKKSGEIPALRPSLLAPIVLLAALVEPRRSHAETAPPAPVKDEAQRDSADGEELLKAGKYGAALEKFERAYAESGDDPLKLYDIGRCQYYLSRYPDATATFSRYLKETADNGHVTRGRREKVRATIAAMTTPVDVTISVQPESAASSASLTISIDRGAPVARERPSKLVPGQHVLDISADGFPRVRREFIVIASGVPQAVPVSLEPLPAAPPLRPSPPPPSPTVGTGGGAQASAVSLEPLPAPAALRPPPASPSSTVGTGAPVLVAPPPPPPPKVHIYSTWWFWTGVGVVITAGATTAYFLSRSKGPDLVNGSLGGTMITP
jgi:hypothetical protein